MFSLIITILSIVLVSATSYATVTYVVPAYKASQDKAVATRIISGGQQVMAAADIHLNDKRDWPDSVEALVAQSYLKAIPTGPNGRKWEQPVPLRPTFVLKEMAKGTCIETNKVSFKSSGVLKKLSTSYATQCYSPAQEQYVAVVTKESHGLVVGGCTDGEGEGLLGGSVICGPGPDPGDPDSCENTQWAVPPAHCGDDDGGGTCIPGEPGCDEDGGGGGDLKILNAPVAFPATIIGQEKAVTTQPILLNEKPVTVHVQNILSSRADFQVSLGECETKRDLEASSRCTLNVTFKPTELGPIAATATVVTNKGSVNFDINGTGLGGELTILNTPVVFPGTKVGRTSVNATQPVLYNGLAESVILQDFITESPDFSSSMGTCEAGGVLPPNSRCTLNMEFTPSKLGANTATAALTSDKGIIEVPVSGTGTDGSIDIYNVPVVFPDTPVGYYSVKGPYADDPEKNTTGPTIVNSLEDYVVIQELRSSNGSFSLLPGSCEINEAIYSDGECELEVLFNPLYKGAANAIGTVVTNKGSFEFNLSGNGTAAIVDCGQGASKGGATIECAAIDFGDVEIGETVEYDRPVRIVNTGSAPLKINSIDFTVSLFELDTDCDTSVALEPGQMCSFFASVTPKSIGMLTDSIEITTSEGLFTLPIRANGVSSKQIVEGDLRIEYAGTNYGQTTEGWPAGNTEDDDRRGTDVLAPNDTSRSLEVYEYVNGSDLIGEHGMVSAPVTVNLYNAGAHEIALNSYTLHTGLHRRDDRFKPKILANDCGTTLQPGARCMLAMTVSIQKWWGEGPNTARAFTALRVNHEIAGVRKEAAAMIGLNLALSYGLESSPAATVYDNFSDYRPSGRLGEGYSTRFVFVNNTPRHMPIDFGGVGSGNLENPSNPYDGYNPLQSLDTKNCADGAIPPYGRCTLITGGGRSPKDVGASKIYQGNVKIDGNLHDLYLYTQTHHVDGTKFDDTTYFYSKRQISGVDEPWGRVEPLMSFTSSCLAFSSADDHNICVKNAIESSLSFNCNYYPQHAVYDNGSSYLRTKLICKYID